MNYEIVTSLTLVTMFIGMFIYFRAQTPAWQKVALKRSKERAKLTNV